MTNRRLQKDHRFRASGGGISPIRISCRHFPFKSRPPVSPPDPRPILTPCVFLFRSYIALESRATLLATDYQYGRMKMTKVMALFFRMLLGVPLFATLFGISALCILFAFDSGTPSLRLQYTALAGLFAAQAYAIWRILLFPRPALASPQPPIGDGSARSDNSGGDPHPRPPDAGKSSPLTPSQTHHLSAAKELPPSDKTQSLPHD